MVNRSLSTRPVSLRTNLFLATVASLGFATVCAVCSAQLDREPPRPQLVAAVKPVMPLDEPVTTGSIAPRKGERPSPEAAVVPASLGGLDQDHLAKLMAGAASERPKLQKAVAKR